MDDNSERPQGKGDGDGPVPFPSDDQLSEQEQRAALVLNFQLQRHALALKLQTEPGFTDDYFLAVVSARCMRLRERAATIPSPFREVARMWARFFEDTASLAALMEHSTSGATKAELEAGEQLLRRFERAYDAFAGAKCTRNCWELLDNLTLWTEVHLAEIAQQIFSTHRGGAKLDVGVFLVELARTVSSDAAAFRPESLAEMYRAWGASNVPSRAREHAGVPKGSKWVAAQKLFHAEQWGMRDPDSIRIEYGKHVGEVRDCRALARLPATRWAMWCLGSETLRRMGIETHPDGWETEWRKRRDQSGPPQQKTSKTR